MKECLYTSDYEALVDAIINDQPLEEKPRTFKKFASLGHFEIKGHDVSRGAEDAIGQAVFRISNKTATRRTVDRALALARRFRGPLRLPPAPPGLAFVFLLHLNADKVEQLPRPLEHPLLASFRSQ